MNEIEERLRGDLFTATYDLEGDLEPDEVLAAAHRARRVRIGRRVAGVAGVAVIASVALLALPGHLPGGPAVAPSASVSTGKNGVPKVRITPGSPRTHRARSAPRCPVHPVH